jgi:hypothetical protein
MATKEPMYRIQIQIRVYDKDGGDLLAPEAMEQATVEIPILRTRSPLELVRTSVDLVEEWLTKE